MTDTKTRTLSPEQHRVLVEHGTERPGSSPLNYEKRPGEFECAGCGAELVPFETRQAHAGFVREEVVRIEVGVTQELISAAVQGVAP